VECDGETVQIADPVDAVLIRAGAGNDFVAAGSFSVDADCPALWMLELGGGADNGLAFVEGILDAPVIVAVRGGAGADNLSVQTGAMINSAYAVSVDGGGDGDTISNFHSGPVNGAMILHSQGGGGDDFILDEFSGLRVNGTFAAFAGGGNGIDVTQANLGGFVEFEPEAPPFVFSFDVAQGGKASYAMSGGNGHDSLILNFTGRIDGRLTLLADGGRDSDDVFAALEIHAESTGCFSAVLLGNQGDDLMEARVRFFDTEPVELFPEVVFEMLTGFSDTPAPLRRLKVLGDGGAGLDTLILQP
jgi:hypothetical protein